MRIYLSGPITGHPNHIRDFADAAERVRATGHEPLDPHDVLVYPHKGDCPEGARNGVADPHTWPCYLRSDIVAMLGCDAVLMLKGWAQSRGACFERRVASKCGVPVYEEETWNHASGLAKQ